jgi:hypothetical protein
MEGNSMSAEQNIGCAATAAQLTQFTGTAERLLGLLSRSRPRAPAAGNATDTQLIRLSQLRVDRGPAVAVVKVARDIRGAMQLRAQRRLVAEIANQPGLDASWREMLPRVLAFDERPDKIVYVESYCPGVLLADELVNDPDRCEELATLALAAIAPLHRATARLIVVDNLSSVRQWIAEPVADLADVCGRMNARLVPILDRLESMLARAIVGRRMTVCWTHGDYTPDNVQLAGRQAPVNRIIGWDEARGDRPALIDDYLMILTTSCQAEGADFGIVVSQRLETGGLSDSERKALNATPSRSKTGAYDSERVDERVAILLTWLHHVAALVRNNRGGSVRASWLATNVAPVLDAVAEWRGFDVAERRTTTQQVTEDAAAAP